MAQHLLEGEVEEPTGDAAEVLRLKELNRQLTRELHDTLEENERLRLQSQRGNAPMLALRKAIAPLYKVMQAIMGEIDASGIDVGDAPAATQGTDSRATAVWQEWQQRMPGATAKVIEALLKHGSADTSQLCVLIGTGRRQTVHDAIHKLNKANLIIKNGDRFSLKQL